MKFLVFESIAFEKHAYIVTVMFITNILNYTQYSRHFTYFMINKTHDNVRIYYIVQGGPLYWYIKMTESGHRPQPLQNLWGKQR